MRILIVVALVLSSVVAVAAERVKVNGRFPAIHSAYFGGVSFTEYLVIKGTYPGRYQSEYEGLYDMYVRVADYREFDSDANCTYVDPPLDSVDGERTEIICDVSDLNLTANVCYRIRLVVRPYGRRGRHQLSDEMSVCKIRR